MRYYVLTVVFVLTLCSFGFTGEPALSEGLVDGGWNQVAVGVFERVENGGVERMAIGLEGLQWDIARIHEQLDETAGKAGLTKDERRERIKILADTLLKLHELELVLEESNAKVGGITQRICVPQERTVLAQTTPFSGAGIHGALAKIIFDGSNCPYMTGEGYVYAYAEGSATGVDEDYESASWSSSFEITAHAGGVYQICDYAHSFLHYLDNADHNYYVSNTYELPTGCYCPTCS